MKHIELTLKEFVIAILHRWKMVLVIALALAVLFGAYGYFTIQSSFAQLEERYQSRLTTYQQNIRAKQASIAYQQGIVSSTEDYNENSLLMQIDPYNKEVASLTFSVNLLPDTLEIKTNEDETLGIVDIKEALVNKIARQYILLAEFAPLSEIISQTSGTTFKESAIKELVSVNRDSQGREVVENLGVITLRAFGAPGIAAEEILDALYQYLKEKQSLISETTAEHSLTQVNRSKIYITDTLLAEQQNRQRNLQADAANQIETLQDEIEALRTQRPAPPSKNFHLLSNAALGFVLGLLLGLVVVIFLYMIQFPIQSPEQLQQQLGLRMLGGYNGKKRLGIRALSRQLAGDYLLAPEQEALGLMAANIAQNLDGRQSVLLTGTLPEEQVSAFAGKLAKTAGLEHVRVENGGSVNKSAQSVQALADTEAVVLVERLQTSRLKEVWQEKERVEQSGKPILGYVLI